MAKIFSQLENAQVENKTSDYVVGTLGRFWVRSDTKKLKFDRGDIITDVLLNDDKLVIGTNGTAASNVRLYRDSAARLSAVIGSEATAEGAAPTALAELAARLPNYTNVGKPANNPLNPGRIIWLTDLAVAQIDTGTIWKEVGGGGGGALFQWNVSGPLLFLGTTAKRLDGTYLYNSVTPTAARLTCKTAGSAGTLDVDVRRHQILNAPIKSIQSAFSAPVVSIAAPLAAINTQSITRHTPQISTQSITRVKATLNIQSVNRVKGTNQWKYTFTGPLLDSDYAYFTNVLIAGCTAGANNGTFIVQQVNHGNQPSIVVTNASGVAQTGAVGTLDLQLFSYNYAAPVSTDYVSGDSVLMASHTTGANNGTFGIYKINQSGNNIWVYNSSGVVQAGVAGNSNNFLWAYNYSSAVNTTYNVVGELSKMASHSTGANNGNLPIRSVNAGGNNIVIYNTSGALQAGVAGNSLPNRWNINFGSDPSAFVSAGETFSIEGSSTSGNNGAGYAVKFLAVNTVNVVALNMVAQAASGTGYSTKYKVGTYVDPATLGITTSSRVELKSTPTTVWEETDTKIGYAVSAVGALDFTITDTTAVLADVLVSPAGFIGVESKSIFSARPTIGPNATGSGIIERELQSANATLVGGAIPADTWLGIWVFGNFTAGTPRDFSIVLY